MYDKFERIAATAQMFACILGNPQTGDFTLLPLTGGPLSCADLERVMLARHIHLCGVIGLVDGTPRTALSEPIDDAVVYALSLTFIDYAAERLTESLKPKDDFVPWAEALLSLPDDRPA